MKKKKRINKITVGIASTLLASSLLYSFVVSDVGRVFVTDMATASEASKELDSFYIIDDEREEYADETSVLVDGEPLASEAYLGDYNEMDGSNFEDNAQYFEYHSLSDNISYSSALRQGLLEATESYDVATVVEEGAQTVYGTFELEEDDAFSEMLDGTDINDLLATYSSAIMAKSLVGSNLYSQNGVTYINAPYLEAGEEIYYVITNFATGVSDTATKTKYDASVGIVWGAYVNKPCFVHVYSYKDGDFSSKKQTLVKRYRTPAVSASPVSGSVAVGTYVTINKPADTYSSSYDIYYTTDGSMPTKTNGTKYTSPIQINEDTTIYARAINKDINKTGSNGYKIGWDDTRVTRLSYRVSSKVQDKYEPNDSLAYATDISVSSRINALISDTSDSDIYKIELTGSTPININLSFPTGTKYGLALLGSNGSTITTSAKDDYQSIVRTLSAGTYYVKVYSISGSTDETAYTLRVYRRYTGAFYDFSERNMVAAWYGLTTGASSGYNGTNGVKVNTGGNFLMSTNYLASWQGPINENLDPYSNISLENNTYQDYGSTSEYHLQAAIYGPNGEGVASRDEFVAHVKNLCYAYGGVVIVYYHDYSCENYINNSYYMPEGGVGTAHSVTIVGWDDNYSKEKFGQSGGAKPTYDGAFIIKNSWGDTQDEAGYFYMSYETYGIDINNPTVYIMEEGSGNYNKQYINDATGAVLQIEYRGSTQVENTFTSGNTDELLSAISHTVLSESVHYTTYLTLGGVKTKILEGSERYAGYYTHNLETSILIPAGSTYTITTTYSTDSGELWIPFGYATVDTGKSRAYSNVHGTMVDTSAMGLYPCVRAFTQIPGSTETIVERPRENHAYHGPSSDTYLRTLLGNDVRSIADVSQSASSAMSDGSGYGAIMASLPYTATAVTSADLPASFDLRTVYGTQILSSVKNQGSYGACWAFAANAAIESNIMLQGNIRLDYPTSLSISSATGGSINFGGASYDVYMTANTDTDNISSRIINWTFQGDLDSVRINTTTSLSGEEVKLLTFTKAGTVTVRATSDVDINIYSEYTLTATTQQVDSISFRNSSLSLSKGMKAALTPQITLASGATNVEKFYESSNPSVASVDRNTGVVTVLSRGTATITVTAGNMSASIVINAIDTSGGSSSTSGSTSSSSGGSSSSSSSRRSSGGSGGSSGGSGSASRSSTTSTTAGSWKRDAQGWWFANSNGSYPTNKWEKINGAWYYFGSTGYMTTGWQAIGGSWYYMNPSVGNMATGWINPGGIWYYMNPSAGNMQTGWLMLGSTWYYLNTATEGVEGSMVTGWKKVGGKYYYFDASGAMLANTTTPDGYKVDASGAWVQ